MSIVRPSSKASPFALALLVLPCAAHAGANFHARLDPPVDVRGVVSGARPRPRGPDGVLSLRASGPATILIPAGTFTMGSDLAEIEVAVELCRHEPLADEHCEQRLFQNEAEAHDVTLSAYRIDRTEVTVGAYQRCVLSGRCSPPSYPGGGERFARPDFPVSLVSWNDADTYCRFMGGRLPTEAEWERAARGTQARRFPWGALWNPRLANHGIRATDETDDRDGFAELAPVGSFPSGRTPNGIDDLAGNVEEWVADANDDPLNAHYPPASEVNPKGASAGAFHAVRGGGYETAAPWLRAAARNFYPSSYRKSYLGFRCASSQGES